MTLIVRRLGDNPKAFALECSVCGEKAASIHEGLVIGLLILFVQ
jgi:hypothetical protein